MEMAAKTAPDPVKVPDSDVLLQMERILANSAFVRSRRLSRFLRFSVEQTLLGHADELKEYRIGTEVFERSADFDPRIDTIVRTQAHRLRTMLANYYETDGRTDPVLIDLPKGSYVPLVRRQEPEVEAGTASPEPMATPAWWRDRIWIAGAVVVLVLVSATLFTRGSFPHPQQQEAVGGSAHLGLPLFAAGGLDVDRGAPVVSPRGRYVVFPLIEPSGERRLWMRALESMSALPLAGSNGGYLPFWSPDESQIGFFAAGQMKIFRLSDGSVRVLCDTPIGRGGTWAADGTILFAPRTSGAGIYKISEEGGVAVPVTTLDAASGENDHRWPEFLADGRHFVYSSRSRTSGRSGIFLASLDGGSPVRLSPIQSQVHHAHTSSGDYLLFVRDNSIRARRLNLSARTLEGPEATLAENVLYTPASGAAFSLAGGGLLAYHTAHREKFRPAEVDRAGRVLREILPPGSYESLTVDVQARRIAVEMMPEKGESDIWISELGRPSLLRLSFDGGGHGVWSRDGRSMYFANPVESLITLYAKQIQDQARPRVVWNSSHTVFPTDVSPDGRFLCVFEDNPATLMDLLLIPLGAASASTPPQPVPFRRTRFNERHGFFSPDGRFLAYVSDESGQFEVYVESLGAVQGGRGSRWKLSSAGGTHPRWNPDGKELFFLSSDRRLMSVTVSPRGEGDLEFSAPRRLFEIHTATRGDFKSPYSVSPDGRSFFLLENSTGTPPIEVHLLTAWSSRLR